jgi:predicted amidohydrolase YtcJ
MEIYSQPFRKVLHDIKQLRGAYVLFAEDILGPIEVGKPADFVVIPVDYMTIPAEGIRIIEPEMTVIGGEIVYRIPVQERK